ncbi:uncharacterized protein [Musca autumnalis]|uniref:uncharacterized protein n=1 Tax=Musca autumnalis TaxID=221902 RepID=UPI003CE9152A
MPKGVNNYTKTIRLLCFIILLLNISILTQSHELTLEFIGERLREPLKYMHRLQLKIRQQHAMEDLENPYIKWFLRYADITKTLKTYNIQATNLRPLIHRDNYVICTDMRTLNLTIDLFGRAVGSFFFIMDGGGGDGVNVNNLLPYFRSTFYEHLVFPIYLLTKEDIFIFDPFALDAVNRGVYGQLIPYNGERDPQHQLFMDMRGYPLKVLLFKSVFVRPIYEEATKKVKGYSGVDVNVAYLLQEHLNFTLVLQEPIADSYGGRLPNGSFNGALGMILNKQTDICFTGFFVKDYQTTDIAFSAAMYDDRLCIYSRKAERVPYYLLPIWGIDYNVWIGFIGLAFLSSFVWMVFRTLTIKMNIYGGEYPIDSLKWQYLVILKDTWVLWVRVDLNHLPSIETEKVFVGVLCFVSVIFGAIFECSLASVHIKPLYFKDIQTLQEFDESGMQIVIRYISMADDLFTPDTSPLFARLHNKTILNVNMTYDLMQDILDNGNLAGVKRWRSLMLDNLELALTKQIWMIPDCPKVYHISYVWLRYAPWEERINYYLLQYLQFGFIQGFESAMRHSIYLEIIKKGLNASREAFKKLRIKDFQLAFYVIIVGNIVSCIVFVLEKCWALRRQRELPIRI